jgi:hypothetical protein
MSCGGGFGYKERNMGRKKSEWLRRMNAIMLDKYEAESERGRRKAVHHVALLWLGFAVQPLRKRSALFVRLFERCRNGNYRTDKPSLNMIRKALADVRQV